MELERLVRFRPFVYHYTTARAAEQVQVSGLWCTADLLGHYGLDDAAVSRLTRFPRFEPVLLDHELYGPTRLSHQRPMLTPKTGEWQPKLLQSLAMTNTTPEAFLDLLARRVFFFPTPYDPAKPHRPATGFVRRVLHDGPLVEVAVRTADLLRICDANGLLVELSAHNAGSTPRGAALEKGRDTWRPVERFDRGIDSIEELVVVGSLPPLMDAIEHVRPVT